MIYPIGTKVRYIQADINLLKKQAKNPGMVSELSWLGWTGIITCVYDNSYTIEFNNMPKGNSMNIYQCEVIELSPKKDPRPSWF